MQNLDYIENFFAGLSEVIQNINRGDIDKVVEILYGAWLGQNTVFLAGNGGSAGTASHFAADLNKCTIFEGMPRMRVFSLVDNVPLVSALTNDDGWDNIYVEQLRNFFRAGDVLICISVHGGSGRDKAGEWSQNLLKAIQYVKDNGGRSVGLAGFDGGAMKELADACIVVPYNTTPHVESFHVILHHLITFCLAEKVSKAEMRKINETCSVP
jgi:D-sedoheptulose 7-phosphate isomerase